MSTLFPSTRNEFSLFTLKVHVCELKKKGLIDDNASVFLTTPLETNYDMNLEHVNGEKQYKLSSVNHDYQPSYSALQSHLQMVWLPHLSHSVVYCRLRLTKQQLQDLHLLNKEPLY